MSTMKVMMTIAFALVAGVGTVGAAEKAKEKETGKKAEVEKGDKNKAAKEEKFGEAEEKNAKKTSARAKKLPRKAPSYSNWMQAKRIAEACEQPVLAIITLDGNEDCQHFRRKVMLRQEFAKEFAPANLVIYSYKLEVMKEKTRRGAPSKAKSASKPDLEALRKSEKPIVTKLMGEGRNRRKFPIVVLLSHKDGRELADLSGCNTDSVFKWMDEVGGELKSAKYDVTITPKLQKMIDADKKKQAKNGK